MNAGALTLTIILALLVSTSAFATINFAVANPVGTTYEEREISPSAVDAKPPTITFLTLKDNQTVGPHITLNCNISVGASNTEKPATIEYVYYKADWEQTSTSVLYRGAWGQDKLNVKSDLTEFCTLLEAPEGKHNITVWATEIGGYEEDTGPGFKGLETIVIHTFHITGSTSVTFTVDATSPSVSVLSVENKTYGISVVPLDFTVNESVSQINYSLDGMGNSTVAGNATLTGLSNGDHNVTIYATDIAGNTGTSGTIAFSVNVPFPTALVATATGGFAVIGAVGVLVYLKKRERVLL
jgi:hypothetical protein